MPLWKLSPLISRPTMGHVDTPIVVKKKKIKTATVFECYDPWAKKDGLLHDGLDRTTHWYGNNDDFDERTREPVAPRGCVTITIGFGLQSPPLPTVEVPHHVIFARSSMNVHPDWRERLDRFLSCEAIPKVMRFTTNTKRIYEIIKSLPMTAESYDSETSWIDTCDGGASLSKCIEKFLVDVKRNNPCYNPNNAEDMESLLSRNPMFLSFDCSHRLYFHPDFDNDNFDQVSTKPFPVDLAAARKRDLVYFMDAMVNRKHDDSFLGFACEAIAQCRPSDIQKYTFHSKADHLVLVVRKTIEQHDHDVPLLRNGCRALCSLGGNMECLEVMVKYDVLSLIASIAKGDKQKDELLQLSVLRFLAKAARTQLDDSDVDEGLRNWLCTMQTIELVILPMHVFGTTQIFEAGLDALVSLCFKNRGLNATATKLVMPCALTTMKINGDHLCIQTHGVRLILFLLCTDSSGEAAQMLVDSPGGFSAILSPMLEFQFQTNKYLWSRVCKILQALPAYELLRVMNSHPDALAVQEAGFRAMVETEAAAPNKGLLFNVEAIRLVLSIMERHSSCQRLQLAGCKVIMNVATWDFCENGPLAVEMVSSILSAVDAAHEDPEGVMLATMGALRSRGTEHINKLFFDFIGAARNKYLAEQTNGVPAFEVFLDLAGIAGETKLSAPLTVLCIMKKFCHSETVQVSGCTLLDAMTLSEEQKSDSIVKDLVEAQAEKVLSAATSAFPQNAPLVAHAGAVVGRMKDMAAL